MNEIILALSVIVAAAGSYLFALRLLGAAVPAGTVSVVFGEGKRDPYSFLLLSFLAWALGSGLRALIPVWGYFGDMPLLRVALCNGIAGFAFLAMGWPALKEHVRLGGLREGAVFAFKEKVLFAVMGILGLLYVYRVFLPWGDADEAALYGYLSKLIAGGRTFTDIFREDGPIGFTRSQLVQSWDAQLYALVNDTYLVRAGRLVNFVFCGAGIFAFLRLVQVRRFWALMGTLLFWATPELSYLALSLKVDAAVMMFELAAFLALIVAFLFHAAVGKDRFAVRVPFCLSCAALLLSAFAFGNRFSGVIPMLLCAGCGAFFLFSWTRRLGVSFLSVVLMFMVCAFVTAPGYWINLAIYHNPVYPVQGFWPFQNGDHGYTADYFKSRWNITGLPPVFLQFYLLFALGTGIELLVKSLSFLSALPMAAMRTESMGWPYLMVLTLGVWPFLRKGHRALDIIVFIFLFQFIAWSLGLHYSRLFVASATLMTLAGVMMAGYPVSPQDKARVFVQKMLKVWTIVALIVALALQLWWFQKRYFGPLLVGVEARYEACEKFLKTKDYRQKNVLTRQEVRQLEQLFLAQGPRPVVYVLAASQEILQVLFDSRIYIRSFSACAPLTGGGKYLLVEPGYFSGVPADVAAAVHRSFPRHVLTTATTGWDVEGVPCP